MTVQTSPREASISIDPFCSACALLVEPSSSLITNSIKPVTPSKASSTTISAFVKNLDAVAQGQQGHLIATASIERRVLCRSAGTPMSSSTRVLQPARRPRPGSSLWRCAHLPEEQTSRLLEQRPRPRTREVALLELQRGMLPRSSGQPIRSVEGAKVRAYVTRYGASAAYPRRCGSYSEEPGAHRAGDRDIPRVRYGEPSGIARLVSLSPSRADHLEGQEGEVLGRAKGCASRGAAARGGAAARAAEPQTRSGRRGISATRRVRRRVAERMASRAA
jgi:hypothetical protein